MRLTFSRSYIFLFCCHALEPKCLKGRLYFLPFLYHSNQALNKTANAEVDSKIVFQAV